MNQIIFLTIIALPLAYFVFQAIKERERATSPIAFLHYGDALPKRAFFATLVSSNSGLSPSLYMIMVYGYFYGMAALPWIALFWISTQLAANFTIKKVRVLNPDFFQKSGTLHEFLGARFNSNKVRIIAATTSIACYLGLISAETILGRELLLAITSNTSFISKSDASSLAPLLTALVVSVVFIYTYFSGFRAVVKTDLMQVCLILLLLICSCIVSINCWDLISAKYASIYGSFSLYSLVNPTGEGIINFVFFFAILNIVFWGFWWPTSMDQWHRVATTKDNSASTDKHLGTSGLLSILYFVFLTTCCLAMGVTVRTLVSELGAESSIILNYLNFAIPYMQQKGLMATICVALICSGLIAAFISTLDSYLVVITQSISSDVLEARHTSRTLFEIESSHTEHQTFLKRCKLIIIASLPAVLLIAIFFSKFADVFYLIYFSFSFMMAIVPVLALSLVSKKITLSSNGAISSILAGGIWSLVTNSIIIFYLEKAYENEAYGDLTLYYNLLYTNPTVVTIISACADFLYTTTHKKKI